MKKIEPFDITKLRHHTTNTIAYIVLTVFCGFLLMILIKSISLYSRPEPDIVSGKEWLTLFKDGFLLLGGAMTTLIGYYFGSKGSDQALMTAEQLKAEAEKIVKEIGKQAPTTDEIAIDIEPIN